MLPLRMQGPVSRPSMTLPGSLPAPLAPPPPPPAPLPSTALQHVLWALTSPGLVSRQLWACLICMVFRKLLASAPSQDFLSFPLLPLDCLSLPGTAWKLWFHLPPVSHSCFLSKGSKSTHRCRPLFCTRLVSCITSDCTALAHTQPYGQLTGRQVVSDAISAPRHRSILSYSAPCN